MASIRIGITCGDPGGVGLELALRAAADDEIESRCGLRLYAGRLHLEREARLLVGTLAGSLAERFLAEASGALEWVELDSPTAPPVFGEYDAEWGGVGREALERAASDLVSRSMDAVMTAPIVKRMVGASPGYPDAFPGQTEFFAKRSGARTVGMMLASPDLCVVPATIHEPLRAVPDLITVDRLVGVAETTVAALRRDLRSPSERLLVCGLNPHAGEGGRLGSEDAEVIEPAIEVMRARGIDAVGPLPADTVFELAKGGGCGAIIGMYHDQVLGPLKALDFHRTVNFTMGLPIVRTSPDHGVAYALAGTGRARAESTRCALRMAETVAANRSGSSDPVVE